MNYYIYKTTNLITNKIYIGQRKVLTDSKNSRREIYLGSGKILQQSIKKHGRKNFSKQIIQYCETKEEVNFYEKFWISVFGSTNLEIGYNIGSGGDGGDLMANHPNKEEINRRRLDSVRKFNRDEGWCKMISSYSKGRVLSEETKLKIKKTKSEKPYRHNEERLLKMSITHLGVKHSQESIEKQRRVVTGRTKSKEHIEKVAKANTGKKRTPEQNKANSERRLSSSYRESEETREKRKLSLSLVPKKLCIHCNKLFDPGNYKKHINKLNIV